MIKLTNNKLKFQAIIIKVHLTKIINNFIIVKYFFRIKNYWLLIDDFQD